MSSSTSAFGNLTALSIDELTPLRRRIDRASRTAEELAASVQRWVAATDLRTRIELHEPEKRVLDVYLDVSRRYPHDTWAITSGEAAHQARAALDNLNFKLFEKYAQSEYDARRIQFPIIGNRRDWKSWLKGHSALPQRFIDRYYEVQPFAGPYTGLLGLSKSNNNDKHEWLQSISVKLADFLGGATFETDLVEEIGVELNARDLTLERDQKSVHQATITLSHSVHDIAKTENPVLSPTLLFRISKASEPLLEYTLAEIREIPRRVSHAMDYINGDDDALLRYRAVPQHLVDEGVRLPDEWLKALGR